MYWSLSPCSDHFDTSPWSRAAKVARPASAGTTTSRHVRSPGRSPWSRAAGRRGCESRFWEHPTLGSQNPTDDPYTGLLPRRDPELGPESFAGVGPESFGGVRGLKTSQNPMVLRDQSGCLERLGSACHWLKWRLQSVVGGDLEAGKTHMDGQVMEHGSKRKT